MYLYKKNYMSQILEHFLDTPNVSCLIISNDDAYEAFENYKMWVNAVKTYKETEEKNLEYYEHIDSDHTDLYIITKTSDTPRKLRMRDISNISEDELNLTVCQNILVYTMGKLRYIGNFTGNLFYTKTDN